MFPNEIDLLRNEIAGHLEVIAQILRESDFSEPYVEAGVLIWHFIESDCLTPRQKVDWEDAVSGGVENERIAEKYHEAFSKWYQQRQSQREAITTG